MTRVKRQWRRDGVQRQGFKDRGAEAVLEDIGAETGVHTEERG